MTSFQRHLSATAWMSAPIALALLSEMAMGLTDTVMLGGIGGAALAAGGLGANIFFTGLIVLQGVLSGVSVFTARALGSGRDGEVPGIYWSGVALAGLLGALLFALVSFPGRLLLLAGEKPALVRDLSAYLHVLRWGVPGGMVGIGMMRQFLPAVGLQRVLLWVVPAAVGVNAGLNWVLIHGVRWGGFAVPAFGMLGSAAATAVTITLLAGSLLGVLHGRRGWRRFVAPAWPRARTMGAMLGIGLPVGLTVTVEAALFLATGFLAGGLGREVLAAHMIAISVCSTSFMVPLSIAQTANVRVAHASGAGLAEEARRAGFAAMALSVGFMAMMAALLTQAPGAIVAAYLGRTVPANAAVVALAVSLLHVAGVFQIVDGAQAAAAGALRGLRDTRVPMLLAAIGYWGIGFWAGRYLAFDKGLGVVGLWWGLSAGLAVAAASLVLRFALRSRVAMGRVRHAEAR
jgi:MATE family multidrug resistance protein